MQYVLLEVLKFRHRDIRQFYTTQDELRIKGILRDLVANGDLTKGRWFVRHWLGYQALRQLATCYLRQALQRGCNSWDRVLRDVSIFVLQSACSCRIGDILLTQGYSKDKCLHWTDVQLRLLDGQPPTIQNITGVIKLRFTKDEK